MPKPHGNAPAVGPNYPEPGPVKRGGPLSFGGAPTIEGRSEEGQNIPGAGEIFPAPYGGGPTVGQKTGGARRKVKGSGANNGAGVTSPPTGTPAL